MKTRTSIFLIVTLMLSSICIFSTAQEKNSVEHENSLLWKISGNGLEKPSYIFGTIHILDSADFILYDELLVAVRNCDVLVPEVNNDAPDFQQQSMMAAMMINDSLGNYLKGEEYDLVDKFFKEKLQIPLSALKQMKPFFLSEMPAILYISPGSRSYEEEFKKMAKSNGKEIMGISTIEMETATIDEIPMEVQVQILVESVDEEKFEQDRLRHEKVVKLYLDQDIDAIFNTMYSAVKKCPEVYQALFPKRHKVWIPNMKDLMNDNTCFFVVGVGHLSGDDGVIEQLRNNAYKVEAVNMNP